MKKTYTVYITIAICMGVLFGTFMAGIGSAEGFGNFDEPVPIDYTDFFNLFKDHHDWNLEYKLNENSSWMDGNAYLTIGRTWIEDMGYWKFNLVIDAPIDVYMARFTFAVDLPVLDYVEKSGSYQYFLNYSGYSAFFDWSDMASIPNIEFTHGVYNDMFYFRFSRSCPAGRYEFDPWFGYNGDMTSRVKIESYEVGSVFSIDIDCDYVLVNNITALIYSSGLYNLTYGIYDNDTKILLGQTELGLVDTGSTDEWITLNFTTPINITSNKTGNILLVAWGNDNASANIYLDYNGSLSAYSPRDYEEWDETLTNPYVVTDSSTQYVCCIYANYTCFTPTVNDTNATLDDEGCYCFNIGPSTVVFIIWLVLVGLTLYHDELWVIIISGSFQSLIGMAVYNSDYGGYTVFILLVFGILAMGIIRVVKKAL